MAVILTQWAFHRVQDHSKRNSDEEVMTFRSWRPHMTRQSYPDNLPYLLGNPFQQSLVPNTLHKHLDRIMTQWAFDRVQEHLKQSSDEEVMTFPSWRSHMTRQSHLNSLPYLPRSLFPAISSTQCPPKSFGWNLDSMVFP